MSLGAFRFWHAHQVFALWQHWSWYMTLIRASQDCVVAAPVLTWHRCEPSKTVWWQHWSWHDTNASFTRLCGGSTSPDTWDRCELRKTVWWQHRSWHMTLTWASQDCVVAGPCLLDAHQCIPWWTLPVCSLNLGTSLELSLSEVWGTFQGGVVPTHYFPTQSLSLFPLKWEWVHTHTHTHVSASFLHFRHTRKDECIDQLKTNLEKMTALISWKPI